MTIEMTSKSYLLFSAMLRMLLKLNFGHADLIPIVIVGIVVLINMVLKGLELYFGGR